MGKVAQCAWQGAYQVTLDHKSGFHNIPLHADSWTYIGFKCQETYYVRTVQCLGWCLLPFTFHSLSDAVAQHIRSRGVPILTWLGDFGLPTAKNPSTTPPPAQVRAALLRLALTIFYRCGYFM